MSIVLNNFCVMLYKYAAAFILGAGVGDRYGSDIFGVILGLDPRMTEEGEAGKFCRDVEMGGDCIAPRVTG